MRKPRIEDVAAAAGVSPMSVSRALRGIEGVSPSTSERILRAAAELDYVPDSNARALSTARSAMVAVSLPTLFNDVFADILFGMRRTLEQAGYATILDTSDYDTDRELAWYGRVRGWRPAAFVLTGTDHSPTLREQLRSDGLPTLEVWDVCDDPIDICVGIDHRSAGAGLGARVAELGYRAPAFVGSAPGLDTRADRRAEGISEAFREAGGRALTRIVVENENAFVAGSLGYGLLDRRDPPDVVFFLNDHMAFGGLVAALTAGDDVPGSLGIVGFNRLDLTCVLDRRITTMETPRRQMGLAGARNLLARLHGVRPERTVTLPCRVVLGDTTRTL